MLEGAEAACILIVDDEAEVRAMLKAALASEGFRISEAGDGAEMMAAINVEVPHLITLDLKLKGEDGLKLAREVRARSNVPIIMITAAKATPSTAWSDWNSARTTTSPSRFMCGRF